MTVNSIDIALDITGEKDKGEEKVDKEIATENAKGVETKAEQEPDTTVKEKETIDGVETETETKPTEIETKTTETEQEEDQAEESDTESAQQTTTSTPKTKNPNKKKKMHWTDIMIEELTMWQDPEYVYAREKGYLYLSSKRREEHGVKTLNITLDSDDDCLSPGQFLLEAFVGYPF